ncbi:MAG: hypothetical protein ACE5EK_08840, partial [Nitrospinales bacterium]
RDHCSESVAESSPGPINTVAEQRKRKRKRNRFMSIIFYKKTLDSCFSGKNKVTGAEDVT